MVLVFVHPNDVIKYYESLALAFSDSFTSDIVDKICNYVEYTRGRRRKILLNNSIDIFSLTCLYKNVFK